MRHAELTGQLFARRIDVDAHDHVGARHPGALHDVQADAAEAEHHHVRAGLDLGGEDHGADAGRDAAADVADLVEGRVLADLGQRDLGHDRVVREGRAAHVVMDGLAAIRKAAGAVRHQSLALRGADGRAQVGLARGAALALAALRRVERDDVIACFQRPDAGADVHHDARAFVAEDRREQALRIGAGERVLVGVADAGGLDLDQHLAGLRPLELDRVDDQRPSRFKCYCRPDVHRYLPAIRPACFTRATFRPGNARAGHRTSPSAPASPTRCGRDGTRPCKGTVRVVTR